jgi:hypothetical protein
MQSKIVNCSNQIGYERFDREAGVRLFEIARDCHHGHMTEIGSAAAGINTATRPKKIGRCKRKDLRFMHERVELLCSKISGKLISKATESTPFFAVAPLQRHRVKRSVDCDLLFLNSIWSLVANIFGYRKDKSKFAPTPYS